MKNIIPPVKGTRDYYPDEMALRNWMYLTIRQVSASFGYQEWEAPMLETIALYAAKSGDELVNQQSFVFPDRGGEMLTLRPELTPSLARMVAQRQNQLVFPLRWWSWGPFWRYERPQRGRTREFFQWNIDLIGVDSPEADAEMIAIAANFLKQVGLSSKQAVILVNDRQLTNSGLAELDVPGKKRPDFLSLIDRRSKMAPAAWDANALDLGLTPIQLEGIKAFLEDTEFWMKSKTLVRLFDALEKLGVREYTRYDPNTIRGLLYYTSTVFEAFALNSDIKRALLGGGRYDNLMAQVGGDPLPAVGFAMGDLAIGLLLESLGLVPKEITNTPAEILVTVFDAERLSASLAFSAELRQAGLKVICSPEPSKLPKQFKYADRMGISTVIVIGPDEASADQVTLKDLSSGNQQTVSRVTAINILKGLRQ
ncbi:MAG: histidine--tRNA ligase [Chloroflexi bacterium RBG_19FT_COMBO_49_13]|nr:MAG: histidine--tRNA ligase [Chloroflexi bacterium RBG_19FT_COMBO_49_13]